MPPNDPEHVLLDLSDYQPRERALELAAEGCPGRYTDIAQRYMSAATQLTEGYLVFCAVVSRMRGLHEGVVREIAADNPHAVLPLTRAWVEVITITMYMLRQPAYAEFVLHGPGKGRPGRKSFEAMFHALKADAAQLRLVYGQLSEYSHFGPLAVWNTHSIEDEDERTVTWTDVPRWRDDDHFRVACAQANELSRGGLPLPQRSRTPAGAFGLGFVTVTNRAACARAHRQFRADTQRPCRRQIR